MDALANQKLYTTDYILSLPDGHRAELLDGVVYNMTPPKRIHQKLVSYFVSVISTHINLRNGDCEVYPAPFAVFLNADKPMLSRISVLYPIKASLQMTDAPVRLTGLLKLFHRPANIWIIF